MSRGTVRLDPNDVLDCMRTDLVAAGSEAKARVSTRLAASIAGLTSAEPLERNDQTEPLPDHDVDFDVVGRSPAIEPVEPLFSVLRQGSGAKPRLLAALLRHPGRWSLAMFSAGALCGAGISAAVVRLASPAAATTTSRDPSSVATSQVARELVDVGEPSLGFLQGEETTRGAHIPLESVSSISAGPVPPVASGGRAHAGRSNAASLAAQQALLDEARVALARGDNGAALRSVDLHARRYPESILTEEREALAIKALAGKGHRVEARVRGERFRTRFPRSLLLPSIDETLGTIP
jgi:hypothetical protein